MTGRELMEKALQLRSEKGSSFAAEWMAKRGIPILLALVALHGAPGYAMRWKKAK